MNAIKAKEKIIKYCKKCGGIYGIYADDEYQLCAKCWNKARAKEEKKMALETTLTESQQKIVEITEGMKDLLLYKNHKYGDSALNPKGIFYKGDSTNSILIRLDDKLGRVISNPEEKPRINDVADIIGYCTLLLISMGVTKEDLAKFMD